MQNLTDATFHAERVKPGFMLVDFWAVWCPPCKAMKPIIDLVSATYPDLNIVKVNTTENPELSTEYKIQAIPSFVLFKDGEIVHRWTGLTGAVEFGKLLESKGVTK